MLMRLLPYKRPLKIKLTLLELHIDFSEIPKLLSTVFLCVTEGARPSGVFSLNYRQPLFCYPNLASEGEMCGAA